MTSLDGPLRHWKWFETNWMKWNSYDGTVLSHWKSQFPHCHSLYIWRWTGLFSASKYFLAIWPQSHRTFYLSAVPILHDLVCHCTCCAVLKILANCPLHDVLLFHLKNTCRSPTLWYRLEDGTWSLRTWRTQLWSFCELWTSVWNLWFRASNGQE